MHVPGGAELGALAAALVDRGEPVAVGEPVALGVPVAASEPVALPVEETDGVACRGLAALLVHAAVPVASGVPVAASEPVPLEEPDDDAARDRAASDALGVAARTSATSDSDRYPLAGAPSADASLEVANPTRITERARSESAVLRSRLKQGAAAPVMEGCCALEARPGGACAGCLPTDGVCVCLPKRVHRGAS